MKKLKIINKPNVIFSVTNCICHDQRILKIAETVSSLNCNILIIGRKSGDCCNSGTVPFGTKRFIMIFRKGFLFYAFFNIRLFFYLLFHNSDILVSNDLDTLLPNFLVSRIKKISLVYDSHEYFTGVPEIQQRPFVKWVWKLIEKSIFPRLKYVMTVSDSIAEKYFTEYACMPLTIRNLSRKSNIIVPFSREELELDPSHLLLILQGTGINIDRGGEELIDAVNLTDKVSLLIIGSGDQYEFLVEKTAGLGLTDRIKFIPKVPWNVLMKYTRSADAGISIDKNSNLNYLFSLPNKLFDYISAGIPVIATNLPEIGKILKEFNCGILLSGTDPVEISKAMVLLRDNNNYLTDLKNNSKAAAESLNWEYESKKVEKLYKSIINEVYRIEAKT